MIGDVSPAEWSDEIDPETGRHIRRLTDGASNAYALYYFVPSVTPDGRYLVFHGERTGEVQLYRIDLATGEIGQLTDGHAPDAGWAVWCEWHIDGIYAHLSAIHPVSGEVWYFEGDEIRATSVASFANRLVRRLPADRMRIGQAAFSPNGRWFAYIHADAARYRALLADREARTAAGAFSWDPDHHFGFRNAIGRPSPSSTPGPARSARWRPATTTSTTSCSWMTIPSCSTIRANAPACGRSGSTGAVSATCAPPMRRAPMVRW